MRLKATFATAAVLMAGLVGLVPGSASAAPDGNAVASTKSEVSMETVAVVGVTRSGEQYVLSFANGREVRLSAAHYAEWSGTEYGAHVVSGGISAANVTTGSCGSEYLFLYGLGRSELKVDTGWNLIRPVLRSEIYVDIYDNGGHTEIPFATGFDDGKWDISATLRGMTKGIARGYVDIASFAILIDGAWCFTLAPSSSTTIY